MLQALAIYGLIAALVVVGVLLWVVVRLEEALTAHEVWAEEEFDKPAEDFDWPPRKKAEAGAMNTSDGLGACRPSDQ